MSGRNGVMAITENEKAYIFGWTNERYADPSEVVARLQEE
jgi:hypothetical protein